MAHQLRDSNSFRDAWALIRAIAGAPGEARWAFQSGEQVAEITLVSDEPQGWRTSQALPIEVRQMLDLYVPLCRTPVRSFVLGHLGQSVDGFVAGADGESRSLNGQQNIVHLHRLRALFDAVVVGCRTAAVDDPQLTTRLVDGPNPVRVVLDSSLSSDPGLKLYSDGEAPTLIVCAGFAPNKHYPSQTRVLRLRAEQRRGSLREALDALRAEGLERVFVEGGGTTVSRGLAERALHRLQIAVAPLIIGSGIRGVALPSLTSFRDALRPACRHFEMGRDVLFDFDLRPERG